MKVLCKRQRSVSSIMNCMKLLRLFLKWKRDSKKIFADVISTVYSQEKGRNWRLNYWGRRKILCCKNALSSYRVINPTSLYNTTAIIVTWLVIHTIYRRTKMSKTTIWELPEIIGEAREGKKVGITWKAKAIDFSVIFLIARVACEKQTGPQKSFERYCRHAETF